MLTEADVKLFQELGLAECVSLVSCEKVIDSLRMRQLDRLKMVLSRMSREEESPFSPKIEEGIRKNDPKMFARAVFVLNGLAAGKR